MFKLPEAEKKLKTKISSYRSALRKEKKEHGSISDGSGKRYILFSLYMILNEHEKSSEYFDWYCKEFPDDAGEPFQKLCWAISLFRMNKESRAKIVLADAMLSNLYLLPNVFGESIKEEYDIWHSSNFTQRDYSFDLPDDIWLNIKENEKNWIKESYNSFDLRRIRKSYVNIYSQLNTSNDFEERKALLKESYSLLGSIKTS